MMMDEPDQGRIRKQLPYALLMVASFVVFNLGQVIHEAARWTDHGAGFMNGVVHLVLYCIIWGLLLIPWRLAVEGICMWRKWWRFRSAVVLAPAILFLLTAIASMLFFPPNPEKRFARFSKTSLPADCKNLKCHFEGGGIRDYDDAYVFETTPDEVQRLVREMKLKHDKAFGYDGFFLERPRDGFPDFRKWRGVTCYRSFNRNSSWFYKLITDHTHTRVYVIIGCI
jgi:hypothetical protein